MRSPTFSIFVYSVMQPAQVPKDERGKLDLEARKWVLLGYGLTKKGYRLYDPNRECVFHSRDVVFNEDGRNTDPDPECRSAEVTLERKKPTSIPAIPEMAGATEENQEGEPRRKEWEETDDADTPTVVKELPPRTRNPPDRYGKWVYSTLTQYDFSGAKKRAKSPIVSGEGAVDELEQSPRCWNRVLNEFLVSLGFRQTLSDPCLYVFSLGIKK